MSTLPLRLDRTAAVPMPAQLATQVRSLIVGGTLLRGDRLPSSRALAADLVVSRAVVEQGYEQLVAEGWLETRRGAGTFVASGGLAPPPAATRPSRRPVERPLVLLDTGTPWIDPRQRAGWRRAWREVSAVAPPPGYDDPRGLPELRVALADRLGRTRGLVVEPDEIVVTAGTGDGLRQLLRVLPPGPIGVEDPGYRAAAATVADAGRATVDVPAAAPITSVRGLAGIYVTPAHQHPLGRVMPAAERLDLLAAARAADAIVIEDDYDSEFRYDVAPVPALASLDRERVAYLGTAAKAVAPALRLGWLVVPPALAGPLQEHRLVTHDGASWPAQRALLTLLRDGWVDKVVRAARRTYAERAPRVAAALSPYAELAGPLAGMYSTWLMPEDRAVAARDAALAAGFQVGLLSSYARSSGHTGLVIGFGGVSDAELDAALAVLTRALAVGGPARPDPAPPAPRD
ncbi:PLP-dependent aminotransferase family protein [Nocardioides sp. BP30]|uniref:MocR-like pyridoxine biosynthesis transcription factor PdxR n=1 Tax=Nocardioides sp. BP30 TaxID=3036374 RepID=UPI0024686D09|nr:PLP-dependent aminotransferase family protein [Nocardioides sp. BP30]WGL53570.1 PLP-dependent aminotransferase family protein [Nocardioides sp. BP30]